MKTSSKKSSKARPTKAISSVAVDGRMELQFDDLSDRQSKGLKLWQDSQASNGMAIIITDEDTLWSSQTDPTRAYRVVRHERNHRGTMMIEYRCPCGDFLKNGAVDCKHIFAEKLRRKEVVVIGNTRKVKKVVKQAERRPARKRLAHDGKTVRTSQRRARQKMPDRIPELVLSLAKTVKASWDTVQIPPREQSYRGGRNGAPLLARAIALVSKIVRGVSADEMLPEYQRMIADGTLPLRQAPSPDTLSFWMNDERMTPILEEFLRLTSVPFREREVGAIIDSSKVSQLMTAHSRTVEYGSDERFGADWAKCHALVGVESMVVMAVHFSGSRGAGTHDSKFLMPLLASALQTYRLEFLLADKAYLSEAILTALFDKGIKAAIPIKKNWFKDISDKTHSAILNLVEWYDRNNNRDFHETYRLRPKVEALFSLLKRMADGYVWSRGRDRKEANADIICTAWKNELLCKFIYLNLRSTVLLEEETGYYVDYMVPERRFPKPSEPLLPSAA